jgi:glutathione-regulated potassium-efflux system ancillary protein KefC
VAEASLLRDAVVYLGAAVVCVPLAKRAGLGSVLGYLIAGCLIGPYGLGWIRDAASTMHFAEFGVVLMLFLIGLELDLKRLTAMRRAVFGGGSLQMATCGAALSLVLLGFGLPWAAALVGGLAIAMSSTAIAVQCMTERNLLNAPIGRSAFAVLLLQDIAAIPLIALVPVLGVASPGAAPAWQQAAIACLAVAAVIAGGRYFARPLMRLVARAEVREIFTALALLLVMGIALLMSHAGLSMGLGAFLAGVLLASSEYRHALEADIEPFKGLLLGLFFIAVGMSVNIDLVLAQPILLIGLTFALLAVKAGALAVIAPRLQVDFRQRWLLAALLAQGGEFAFVVIGAARTAALLAPRWEALLTAAVALSMAATPFLLLLYDYLCGRQAQIERAADPIDERDAEVIVAGFGRYGQIVTRLLLAQDRRVVVLEHDPDQIDLLRKFGFKVFYGDASRLDLLHAAGAAQAKLLVVAIDDVTDSLALVDLVRHNFPRLEIVARARNVRHWLELRERGVEAAERETFEAALRTGRAALEALGLARYAAREFADNFRRRNAALLSEMLPHFRDEAQLVARTRSARQELEQNLRRDREEREREHPAGGWN